VTVSIWPDKQIEVDDAEYLDLKAQGLLVGESDQSEPPAPKSQAKHEGSDQG
jgi:hypothetical protein